MDRSRVRNILAVGLGIAFSLGFAYFAIRDVHLQATWAALRESNAWWIIPSVGLLAAGTFVRAIRWRFLFDRTTRPPLYDVSIALLIGCMFNNILPMRAGEAARVVSLHRNAGTSRSESLATVLVERVVDVATLLALFFVCAPWLPHVSWLRGAAVVAIVLAVGITIVVVCLLRYGSRPIRMLLRPLARIDRIDVRHLDQAADNLARGMASLRRPRLAVASVLWTLLSWLLLSLSYWVLMFSFGFHLPALAGVLVNVALGVAMVIPSSPGSVGVFEAATIVALSAYGVPRAEALSYALVLHAVNFFPFLLAGVPALRAHPHSSRSYA